MRKLNELTDWSYSTATMHAERVQDRMGIMGEVRLIGGALVFILLIAYVLNEVYSSVDIADGPFSGIVDDLETTGVAAMGLLVLCLLVVAASAIMRFFGGAGFGAR
jgi:hypothetical protein